MPPLPASELHLAAHGPHLGHGPEARPDPADVERWLGVARARLEDALSSFDEELLQGVEVRLAASRSTARFMAWTRRSVAGLVSVRGAQVVGLMARSDAREEWDDHATRSIEGALKDPNGVERFLWRWLEEVHGAVATGYASLHADVTAW